MGPFRSTHSIPGTVADRPKREATTRQGGVAFDSTARCDDRGGRDRTHGCSMPRLGSSLEARYGEGRRGPSLGRRGASNQGRHDVYNHHNNYNDGDISWGSDPDEEEGERDRLLLVGSATAAESRPLTRRVHGAYAEATRCGPWSSSSARPFVIVALVVLALVLRNAAVHDYRGDMIETLRRGGAAQEEIDRLFPKTLAERKQKALDDHSLLESLHAAVAALRVEVDEIKQRLGADASSSSSAAARESPPQPPREPTPPKL